ncbi:transposable element Tcb2 transposase [Trichonephila clavipes]|nr:transposable element Tcb2 transposase [Trichonephila clavipes]
MFTSSEVIIKLKEIESLHQLQPINQADPLNSVGGPFSCLQSPLIGERNRSVHGFPHFNPIPLVLGDNRPARLIPNPTLILFTIWRAINRFLVLTLRVCLCHERPTFLFIQVVCGPYVPEETGGRQREKSLDTRHRRLDDRYRVLPWPEDCTVVVCLHDALYDESRFSLSSDSHRILIWRERGSHNHPSNIIERDRYGGRGVLVWGGIMLGSRTDLHIFDAGSVNGTRYCNEILLPYVRLFRGAMGLQFLFMDDNAPCHRTVATEQLLESEDIERMDWPARSPDLNPIEHVWDFLGRRLAARTLPPVTIRELRLALQDEWAAMPQQLIDTLILSMGRRCETCLAVRGRSYPLLKTGFFLLDTHHRDVSAFSRIALHATFSIKLLFIPLISLLVSVAYITHVLTYWGSYGIKCVDLESFCSKLY